MKSVATSNVLAVLAQSGAHYADIAHASWMQFIDGWMHIRQFIKYVLHCSLCIW